MISKENKRDNDKVRLGKGKGGGGHDDGKGRKKKCKCGELDVYTKEVKWREDRGIGEVVT